MKDDLLELMPGPVKKLLQKKGKEGALLIDLVAKDAEAYCFHPEEIAPCIMAAYYVYESLDVPAEMEEEWRVSYIFIAACRSALKLLSYGKYQAERTESGWMKYAKGLTQD